MPRTSINSMSSATHRSPPKTGFSPGNPMRPGTSQIQFPEAYSLVAITGEIEITMPESALQPTFHRLKLMNCASESVDTKRTFIMQTTESTKTKSLESRSEERRVGKE